MPFHSMQPFEPNALVIAGSIIVFIGAALANAGGVGGGGLFVPMFNLFLGYDAKTSTALSKCECGCDAFVRAMERRGGRV